MVLKESMVEVSEKLGEGWERLNLECPACHKGVLTLRVHFEDEDEPADVIIAETKGCPNCGVHLESALREQ